MGDWINYWLGSIWQTLRQMYQWVIYNLGVMVTNIIYALQFVWDTLVLFARWVAAGARLIKAGFVRAVKALLHLDFRSIWRSLRCAYERFQRARAWWKRHVQDPIDKIRKNIMDIYRTFFQPIIRFLDSLRVFVRFIALFNRKLAAKLDARLWGLEAKILSPITTALRRLNSISSHLGALVTALGYLDRVTLLESLRRDASLVWEVLTNPRGALHSDPPGITHTTLAQVDADFDVYARAGGGPLADRVDDLDRTFQETRVELGV